MRWKWDGNEMVIWQHYSSHQGLRQTRHIHTDTSARARTGKLIFMDQHRLEKVMYLCQKGWWEKNDQYNHTDLHWSPSSSRTPRMVEVEVGAGGASWTLCSPVVWRVFVKKNKNKYSNNNNNNCNCWKNSKMNKVIVTHTAPQPPGDAPNGNFITCISVLRREVKSMLWMKCRTFYLN